MPTTALSAALTERHRAEQLAVRAGSIRNLITLWRAVDPANLSGTIDTFTQAAVLLAGQDYDRSSASSARYYRLFRAAEGVPGRSGPVSLAPRLSPAYAGDQLRGAALSGIINGRRGGKTLSGALQNGLVKTIGAMAKLVLTGGRMTIIEAVQRDPQALGYRRVTSGTPCAFCRMVAGRGDVYKTQKSADFETHGGCGCTASPFYAGDDTRQSDHFSAEYREAQRWAAGNVDRDGRRTDNDALNNYRLYLAKTGGSSDPIPEAGAR